MPCFRQKLLSNDGPCLWIASRVSACICRRRSPGLHIGSISSTRLDASALWQGCFRIGSRRADMGSDLLALRGGPAVLLASRRGGRASTILLKGPSSPRCGKLRPSLTPPWENLPSDPPCQIAFTLVEPIPGMQIEGHWRSSWP